jgi:hypothetical protein
VRISVERSGGVAGLTLAASVDADALPAPLAATAAALDWGALGGPVAPGRPDAFSYRFDVEHAGGQRSQVVLGDGAVPDDLRPLLDELLARARPVRPGEAPAPEPPPA